MKHWPRRARQVFKAEYPQSTQSTQIPQIQTKSELGATATSQGVIYQTFKTEERNDSAHSDQLTLRLVATTTPRGLPARGPRSAPSSDFVCRLLSAWLNGSYSKSA